MAELNAVANVLDTLSKAISDLSTNIEKGFSGLNDNSEKLNDRLSKQLEVDKKSKEKQDPTTGLRKAFKNVKINEKGIIREGNTELVKALDGLVQKLPEKLEKYAQSATKNSSFIKAGSFLENKAQSIKSKATSKTGLRGTAAKMGGSTLGGLGKSLGALGKLLPILVKFLGPMAMAAMKLVKVFDMLEGTLGFLISGAIALIGTYVFTWIEIIKDIIKWFKMLPERIGKFFSEDLPILFEAAIIKLKETFTNLYNYLQEKIFQPLADYLYEAWEGVLLYWDEFKAAFNQKIEEIADSIYETWEGVKIWYNELKQKFSAWLEEFADGLYEAWEGIVAYKDELMASISNMINNIKQAAIGMFTNIIGWIKEKIDAVLDIGGKAVDAVKGWFGFGGDEQPETVKEQKELTPEEFPSGIVNQNAAPVINIEANEEQMKLINETLKQNQQQNEKLDQSFKLLINTIDKKELGTTVINNTAPTPTQSYSNGGKVRR